MAELSTAERIAQLEKIVATQSEMILKLVEMMNHLGSESAATNERLAAASEATAKQFAMISNLLERLAAPPAADRPPNAN